MDNSERDNLIREIHTTVTDTKTEVAVLATRLSSTDEIARVALGNSESNRKKIHAIESRPSPWLKYFLIMVAGFVCFAGTIVGIYVAVT